MGGKNTTTQTTTSEPYKAAQPLLGQGMGDALNLYKNGGLVKPNTMSTVVPYANQTVQGMQGLQALGNANTGGNGVSGHYQDIINSGGFNTPQNEALAGIRQTATGDFDLSSNPAFQQVLGRAQGDTINAVTQAASAMGRTGSGAHQGVMAREVGDLTARMVGDEYRNWQGRQDGAQQALFAAGQTGMENLGGAYQGAQDSYSPLMQVGSMYEDLAGRNLNDQLRIANETANAPFANIQALLGAASGAGQYGTQSATAQGPSNTFSNILGAGLGTASLARGGKL